MTTPNPPMTGNTFILWQLNCVRRIGLYGLSKSLQQNRLGRLLFALASRRPERLPTLCSPTISAMWSSRSSTIPSAACKSRMWKLFKVSWATLKLTSLGVCLILSAAFAIKARIMLYTSKWTLISLRTIAGLSQRRISIFIMVLMDLKSSSTCQRST